MSRFLIPFRLHWSKFLPEYNYKGRAVYPRSQYPRGDDFMRLRENRDPKNVFFSSYWRKHLSGSDKPD